MAKGSKVSSIFQQELERANRDESLFVAKPGASAGEKFIDAWLRDHLRQTFSENSNGPMPRELSDMIERLKKNRRAGDEDHEETKELPCLSLRSSQS